MNIAITMEPLEETDARTNTSLHSTSSSEFNLKERREEEEKKSTHLLQPLLLCLQFPHQVKRERWKEHPAQLLHPPALPCTLLQIVRGFGQLRDDLCEQSVIVYDATPAVAHTHTLLFFNPSV